MTTTHQPDFVHEQLTDEHAETVRATLPLVGSKIAEIAPNFYQRMFSAHPDLLRDTFNRGNQAQGAQQKALAASAEAEAAAVAPTRDSPIVASNSFIGWMSAICCAGVSVPVPVTSWFSRPRYCSAASANSV